ncbi:MAG: FtsX-like permease family protein [Acidobacteriota bacterium]
MKYFSLILKNSWRNRRRSLLTIASISASICLLGLVAGLYTTLYLSESTPEQALRLVINNRVSMTQPLPLYYREKIQQIPGVKAITIFQWFGGVYKDNRDSKNFFARFGVNPKTFFKIYPEIQMPDNQKQAWSEERQACIVGEKLVQRFGWKLGDRITLKGDIFPVDLELVIRGIYQWREFDESLYFNIDYLYEGLPATQRDQVFRFTIEADSKESVSRVAKEVDEMFRNATAQTRTETEQTFLLRFVNFIGNVKLFLLAISSAVTFTILLVSANTISMSVRERIKEVGVLKTLGFTREAILAVILGESGFIALVGGALGLMLTSGLFYLVRQGPAFIPQMKTLALSPITAVICLILAAFIGIASAIVPAWQASRTSIVETLRHIG